jgi:hypothetical protein
LHMIIALRVRVREKWISQIGKVFALLFQSWYRRMQLCVMKRTIPRRILSFDRMLSDILLLKLTLKSKSSITLFLQPFEDKIEFFKVKKALLALLEFLAFLKFLCLVTLVVLNSQLSLSVVSVTQLKLFANVSAVSY